MAKRIVFFNHKGGVSKTTTTYNLGWKLAERSKVLLVDADPQCNLSSMIIENFDEYYLEPSTKHHNLRDAVEVAFKGRPAPIQAIDCFTPTRAPNLFLLPGHPNLTEYDASLTFAQNANNAIATLENLPGAFHALLKEVEQKYDIDYTLIDLNPGLSSINQNFVVSSDFIIVPTNPDPFSIMAIDTLKVVLPKWAKWQKQSYELFEHSSYPMKETPPKLLGSVIQRFNIRKGRAALPFRDNMEEIKQKVINELLPALQIENMAFDASDYGNLLTEHSLCLAEISDFQSLLPKAMDNGVPVFALEDQEIRETGPVLEQLKGKRTVFDEVFENFAAEVVRLTDL
ncbi:ParA family protein [Alteromonas sp. ASW11-19]|uniref:ParA family protein n=1 Tax=Alteromonas salexigens TaxID=2982530 RepID=A0ABT2VNB1_9ALTE|nr:ParA family protein [Alteromonas salexigens]MCU7554787.1 ParA family protein [Alteromonas salexigens]